MSITCLMRRLSLIDIDARWQLSLGCLLMRTIASFQRYTGYLNFMNGPISRVLLLILVHSSNGNNLFWSIKNSGEILNKSKSRGFLASSLSTYEPRHEISNNVVCATSKASAHPVHTRSLIRAFLVA